MNIGLFFGSFNPVHTGHLLIAGYFTEHTGLDQVWFVVSPQNPFKIKDDLVDEYHRIEMIRLAIDDDPRFKASDIEFGMSRPSYTVDTLSRFRESCPEHTFYPIIGGDNLETFHLWKDASNILRHHIVYVYKRPGYDQNPLLVDNQRITIFEVPLLDISSTYIREMIMVDKSVKYLVPEAVEKYIHTHRLYK